MSSLDSKPLLVEGQSALQSLRRALGALVASVGGDAGQSQDISRRFGVDKTLAWRITRAIKEEDPWEALQHVPTRTGVEIFAGAMAKAGAPTERLREVQTAYDHFERFVETHAGDRDTLDMIVSSPTRGSAEKKLEGFRKSGFVCNSSLLGVRASLHFGVHLAAPNRERPEMIDIGLASGLLGLCRLRSSVSWSIAAIKNWGGVSGNVLDPSRGIVPIEDPGRDAPSPMLREFCTPPTLEVRASEQPAGTFRYFLDSGPVGFSGSVTTVTGRVHFATGSRVQGSPGEMGEHGANLTTPCEELVFDLLVHRDMDYAMDVSAQVYSQFPGGPIYPEPGSESMTMPVPLRVVRLGVPALDPPRPQMEWYGRMLERIARRMGREPGEFEAFRYRLKFPPVPSMVVLRHPLRPA